MFILFLLCVLFSGCGVLSKNRRSVLAGPEVTGIRNHEKVILNDLDIHLTIYNDVHLWSYMTFFLPFVPIFIDPFDYETPPPLMIKIGILPKSHGLSFEPKKFVLIIDEESSILPNKILALPCANVLYDDYVTCRSINKNSKPILIDNSLKYQLKEGFWNCFILYFDIAPPNPLRNINVCIDGIRIDGELLEINKLGFHKENYYIGDSAP